MAKVEGRVAKRYARALFELCPPAELEGVDGILRELAATWNASHELREALSNPAIPVLQRKQVLEALVSHYRRDDRRMVNFFVVLLENGRLEALPQISVVFKSMLDEMRRMLALEITSAFELSESEKSDIQRKIQSDYGSLATITWKTNPDILGGLIIKYGDRLLDASVSGTLENLRSAMIA